MINKICKNVKRIKRHLELYDIIRIDHFRGFAGYYAIPYGDATARYGAWHSAPGKELFKTVNETFNDAKIIAEDLGFITPDVRELLEYTGYPGMKILQFAFYDEDAEYLPRMYKSSNCVVYTGSHDADCSNTWIKNISGDALNELVSRLPIDTNVIDHQLEKVACYPDKITVEVVEALILKPIEEMICILFLEYIKESDLILFKTKIGAFQHSPKGEKLLIKW